MPKPCKFRNDMRRVMRAALRISRGAGVLACVLSFGGCGILFHPGIAADLLFGTGAPPNNPNTYHIGAHEWVGDSISVRVYRTSEPSATTSLPKITAECLSCNLTHPPEQLAFNSEDRAIIYFPEARQLISSRLELKGSGIDTTFIQFQRPPAEATAYFHLSRPLVGRVFVNQLAPLYLDTTQDSVVTSASKADELNIYGEHSAFYLVHHPNFPMPLYLLKSNAVRMY
ncbi:MAG TPA: hypothetical protein VFH95_09090 [Candidatus Kapabacteria bacterium]|nr:hypothetical protein [Candidatus Kapabacteria bacterium]